MQAPSRSLILALLAVSVCTLGPRDSFSHGVMTTPASRAIGLDNEDYQFCFGEPECVCGEYPEAGEVVATYQAGQTISVTIDVTQSHEYNAVFRFQLCPPDELSSKCFTEGELVAVDYDGTEGPRTYQLTLPEGIVCDPCVLRWKWDYGFLSCADVRIVDDGVAHDASGWTSLKATFR